MISHGDGNGTLVIRADKQIVRGWERKNCGLESDVGEGNVRIPSADGE